MYRIRHAFKRRECRTTAALRAALWNDYRNESVAIECALPSGITKSLFLDVLANGQIVESYGQHLPVSIQQIHAWAME